ncbi:MAG TPA: hypothetical protein VNI57_03180, partial [Candidatus Saccharimonadales bacterium]|nr:hypothetical protein [Candidatus Saccharimonadales bacterium]
MTPRSKALILVWLTVIPLVVIGTVGWVLHPELAGRWAFVIFFLPGLWAFTEAVHAPGKDQREVREILDWLRILFAGVAALIAMKAGFRLAVAQDWIDPAWVPAVQRLGGVLFGVGMVLVGNSLPKLLSPWSVSEEPFDWQRVHRFCGWVATFGGTACIGAWLTLPPQ